MAELAQHIELVIRDKGPTALYIDGEEFPWHVTSDDLELTSDMDGTPLLQVGILAQRITTRFENGPYEATPLPEEYDPNFFETTSGGSP